MSNRLRIALEIISMLAAAQLWIYGAWKGYTTSEWGIIGQITIVYLLLKQDIKEAKP